jgi:HEAT repeat protein
MTESFENLVARLSAEDTNERGRALGELIERGSAAAPALLGALKSADPRVRALAAEALGRIGDAASADRLFDALDDGDEQVRSQAAAGLTRLNDPRAFDALIRTLNDNHDLLRADLSLSAYMLRKFGPPALPRVAPLLKSDDAPTRAKAFWIVRAIVSDTLGEDGDWGELWESLGSYDSEAPTEERDRAADLWAAWIERHAPGAKRHD